MMSRLSAGLSATAPGRDCRCQQNGLVARGQGDRSWLEVVGGTSAVAVEMERATRWLPK